jgi:superfamily I DNA and/or RNA helicase
VARYLKIIARKFGIENAGTVHTTQGKEADVVISVLGASSPANYGARTWASAKPNLLNVAVSRAIKRFYIIGNKDAWKTEPYFGDAINFMQN